MYTPSYSQETKKTGYDLLMHYCTHLTLTSNYANPKIQDLKKIYDELNSPEQKNALWEAFFKTIQHPDHMRISMMSARDPHHIFLTQVLTQDRPPQQIKAYIDTILSAEPNLKVKEGMDKFWVAALLVMGIAPKLEKAEVIAYLTSIRRAFPDNPTIQTLSINAPGVPHDPNKYDADMMYLQCGMEAFKDVMREQCRDSKLTGDLSPWLGTKSCHSSVGVNK